MLNKFAFALISMLLFSEKSVSQSQKNTIIHNQYFGQRFKDYYELKGLQKISSTVINLHYGVAHLRKEEKNILLLSKFENSSKSNDDFHLRVIDMVEMPNFNKQDYTLAVKGCSQNGKRDATIFALISNIENKAVKAWKLDKPSGKIHDIATTAIRCKNDGYEGMVVEDYEVGN